MNALKCRTLASYCLNSMALEQLCLSILKEYPHEHTIVLLATDFSHFGHTFDGPGFISTLPLTINNFSQISLYTNKVIIYPLILHT